MPSSPLQYVAETIERELGAQIDEIFEAFQKIPVASASIGQVSHLEILKS